MARPPGLYTKRFHESPIEELREMYEVQKLSVRKIAKRFGISYNVVYQRLKRAGIPLRTKADPKTLHVLFDAPRDVLIDLHVNQGKSCKEIGCVLSSSEESVRRRLVELGVERNSNIEKLLKSRLNSPSITTDNVQNFLYNTLVGIYGRSRIVYEHRVDSVFIDIAIPIDMVAIEVDSSIHNKPAICSADRRKESILESHGWSVVRFTHDEILENINSVLLSVQAMLSTSAWEPEV